MTRFRSSALSALLMLVGTSCAFEDGEPWGRAEISLEIAQDNAGRIEDGKFKTSKDYLIELTAFRVDVETISLSMSEAGSSLERFDPSDPPDGYGNCHAGHCHADDGRLVDYEDIEAELNGSVSQGPALVQYFSARVEPTDDGVKLEPGECTDDCDLPRGNLSTVELRVRSLEVEGRVFDARGARLPAEGVPVRGSIVLEQTFSQLVYDQVVGEGAPLVVGIDASWTLTNRLFDGVEFDQAIVESSIDLGEPSVAAVITETIAEESLFDVSIHRRDP